MEGGLGGPPKTRKNKKNKVAASYYPMYQPADFAYPVPDIGYATKISSRRKKTWSKEEDARLMSLWHTVKNQWDLYLCEFPDRTRAGIRQHLKKILKKQRKLEVGCYVAIEFGMGYWRQGNVTNIYNDTMSVEMVDTNTVEDFDVTMLKYKIISEPASTPEKKAETTKGKSKRKRRSTKGDTPAPEENPYLGVTWDKYAKKWKVHVHHQKKIHHCGYFIDLVEAAHAFDQKSLELKGEKAKLNFPMNRPGHHMGAMNFPGGVGLNIPAFPGGHPGLMRPPMGHMQQFNPYFVPHMPFSVATRRRGTNVQRRLDYNIPVPQNPYTPHFNPY
eukprot:UN06984